MKQLTVISGKGGTGKTTITGAFASLAKNVVIADCDVDAPDLHLILKPRILKEEAYCGQEVAKIKADLCTGCGECKDNCRYGAVTEAFSVDPFHCEGCAVCTAVCSRGAAIMGSRISGKVFTSRTRFGPMVHARLEIGEEASGKLVSAVRENAKKIAIETGRDLLLDGPPGIGCPVLAAISGSDLVLLVSEPTVSGLYDLKRVLEAVKHFRIPAAVCINKCSINKEKTQEIESFCFKAGIPVVGRLPYDDIATKAMLREKSIIEYAEKSEFAGQLLEIWTKVQQKLIEIPEKGTGRIL